MVERLLLDGIHRERGGTAVAKLNQASGFVLADEAEAVLAFSDVAVARAEVAVETAVGHRLPPARLVDLGCRTVNCMVTTSVSIVAPNEREATLAGRVLSFALALRDRLLCGSLAVQTLGEP